MTKQNKKQPEFKEKIKEEKERQEDQIYKKQNFYFESACSGACQGSFDSPLRSWQQTCLKGTEETRCAFLSTGKRYVWCLYGELSCLGRLVVCFQAEKQVYSAMHLG